MMAVGLSWAECTDPRMSQCVCCKSCWLNWLSLIDTCRVVEISHWLFYLLPEFELSLVHWPADVGLSVASVVIFLKIDQRVLYGGKEVVGNQWLGWWDLIRRTDPQFVTVLYESFSWIIIEQWKTNINIVFWCKCSTPVVQMSNQG